MSDDATFDRFKRCAVEILAVEESQWGGAGKFGDAHDAARLDLGERVMVLEEEFDVSVEEEELDGIETVGQAFNLIKGKLG